MCLATRELRERIERLEDRVDKLTEISKKKSNYIFRVEGIIKNNGDEQEFVQYSHIYATKHLAEVRIADLKTVYRNAKFWIKKEKVINSYQ